MCHNQIVFVKTWSRDIFIILLFRHDYCSRLHESRDSTARFKFFDISLMLDCLDDGLAIFSGDGRCKAQIWIKP